MADDTGVEWTDSTFNAIRGCRKVSPACKNCYAVNQVNRYGGDFLNKRVLLSESGWRKPIKWNRDAAKAGLDRHSVLDTRDGKRRRRVFAYSLGDVFEQYDGPISSGKKADNGKQLFFTTNVTNWKLIGTDPGALGRPITMRDVRARFLRMVAETINLDWQILTKRIEHVNDELDACLGEGSSLPYAYLGVTVEDQEMAHKRIPELVEVSGRFGGTFLSIEPMLEPINLSAVWLTRGSSKGGCPALPFIDWVIIGGESGPGARPTDPEWVRGIIEQCKLAGVPVFFKQWGEWLPYESTSPPLLRGQDGSVVDGHELPDLTDHEVNAGWYWPVGCSSTFFRMGKERSGRSLDGNLYNGYPTEMIAEGDPV
jgi:protein gp37